MVDDFVINKMGCMLLTASSTIRAYHVQDGLQMHLRYYHPTRQDDHMFIGSVEWLHLGHPAKKELFSSDMRTKDLCNYLVRRVLDYTFK